MRLVKITNPKIIQEMVENSDVYSFLGEYKVGLTRTGKEITMALTEKEMQTATHALSCLRMSLTDPAFNENLYQHKYEKALRIFKKLDLSLIKTISYIFKDTFTLDEEDEK